MKIAIRKAEERDIDWMLVELAKFSQFMGTKRELIGDPTFSKAFILSLINTHLALVAEREDQTLLGFVAAAINPHLFNPAIKVMGELFFWVSEEHRGSRAALMLINELVARGKNDANWITFSIEEKSPLNERALISRGFKLIERSYLLEVS